MPAVNAPAVFAPRSLADLLDLLQNKPEITICAGGTYLFHPDTEKYFTFPGPIASIKRIEELTRINRTERYLEVGSAVTLARIAKIGSRIVPSLLARAIESIAYPPVRTLATIGGNICARNQRLTLFPVLFILDARVEIRDATGSRWQPLNRLIGPDGDIELLPTEVLTRVRIPLGEWSRQHFRCLAKGPDWDRWDISFCGIANTDNNVLSDFRCAFGSLGKTIVRNREIEAELVSRKLPLPEREINVVCRSFESYLDLVEGIATQQKAMAVRLFRWFLSTLDLH